MNNNIVGARFGHWTVLEEAPSKKYASCSRRQLKCQCDCGTISIVDRSGVVNGKSTNCGCRGAFLKPGEQYQEWTVLEKAEPTQDGHHRQQYLCRCSCGIERVVRMADLKNGKSVNCGHNRYTLSKGAQSIKTFLEENNIPFWMEYTFIDLPKRRFDFALYDIKTKAVVRLIEFDGQQHDLNSKSSWHTEELVQRDIEKNQYALSHRIPLVRIPYYKITITEQDLFGEKYLVEE